MIRTDNSLDFNYSETGNFNNLKIAPFILINFIENAFKYGFNAEENSKISIKISIQGEKIHFMVFNKVVNLNINERNSLKVGLKNTLEHLNKVYPKKHTIIIHENDHTYQVDLKISLT